MAPFSFVYVAVVFSGTPPPIVSVAYTSPLLLMLPYTVITGDVATSLPIVTYSSTASVPSTVMVAPAAKPSSSALSVELVRALLPFTVTVVTSANWLSATLPKSMVAAFQVCIVMLSQASVMPFRLSASHAPLISMLLISSMSSKSLTSAGAIAAEVTPVVPLVTIEVVDALPATSNTSTGASNAMVPLLVTFVVVLELLILPVAVAIAISPLLVNAAVKSIVPLFSILPLLVSTAPGLTVRFSASVKVVFCAPVKGLTLFSTAIVPLSCAGEASFN